MRQDYIKHLDRAVLDVSRLQATQHPTVADLLEGLSAADPAAALWMLRASAYRHATALRPDSNKAQVCTVWAVGALGWAVIGCAQLGCLCDQCVFLW